MSGRAGTHVAGSASHASLKVISAAGFDTELAMVRCGALYTYGGHRIDRKTTKAPSPRYSGNATATILEKKIDAGTDRSDRRGDRTSPEELDSVHLYRRFWSSQVPRAGC